MIMMRPRIPFVKMAQNMAVGTARLALRVSSPIWMTLSKAGTLVSYCQCPSKVSCRMVQLTAEQEDVRQRTKVCSNEIIVPAGRDTALKEDIGAVAGRHDPEDNKEDEKHANIEDTR